jgi:hypothetical protein
MSILTCISNRLQKSLGGLAVETNVPIMSATQTTRSGFSNSDVGLEDTSESFGLPATADLMFALISNEELEAVNQIAVKQLKNRYNDVNVNKRFVIGIDRSRMRLMDLDESNSQVLRIVTRQGRRMILIRPHLTRQSSEKVGRYE